MERLPDAPAIVAAILDPVDHLKEVLPDVPGPELARLSVEAELPDVAKADAIDLRRPVRMSLRPPSRVVHGNAIGLVSFGMIDINPEDRTEPVPGILTSGKGIISKSAIPQSHIEKPIRTEGDRSAVMILVRVVRRDPDPALAGRIRLL